jgi:hypothetical protein
MMAELAVYMRGWGGYYAPLQTSEPLLRTLDSWCRRRVRQYLWVQWKTAANRCRRLIRGGVDPKRARQVCFTKGNWAAARYREVSACLSNARLATAGFVSLAALWAR